MACLRCTDGRSYRFFWGFDLVWRCQDKKKKNLEPVEINLGFEAPEGAEVQTSLAIANTCNALHCCPYSHHRRLALRCGHLPAFGLANVQRAKRRARIHVIEVRIHSLRNALASCIVNILLT